MIRRIKANPTLSMASAVVWAFMLAAAAISALDIIHLAERYGVPAPISWTAPVFIDGLAWLGKMGRSERFDPSTRRAGLKLLALGGALSLAANITVGETVGMKVYGALVVVGFIIAEWYSAKLKPAPEAKPEVDEETKARRSAAAKKAAATRKKRNAAAKRKAARQPRTPKAPEPASADGLEESWSLPAAPVSGA